MLRLLISYIAVVVFLTLNPWILPDSNMAIGFLTWDMLEHAGAYGVLSIILMFTLVRQERIFTMTTLIILGCGFMGVFLEFCQSWFTTTRQLSLFDSIANFSGAFLGAITFLTLRILQPHR